MARRILIVDDDPEVRQGLTQVLGYVPDVEVVAVPGAVQGRAAGLQGSWDLIISDEQMPDGRGSELLGELRRQRPGPHQVLMSGFRDIDLLLRGVNAAHIDHFFQKPYDPMHVLDYVQRILRERESPAAAPRAPRDGPFRRLGAWGRGSVEPSPHPAAPPLTGAPPTPPGPKVAPKPLAALEAVSAPPAPPAAPAPRAVPRAAPAALPAPAPVTARASATVLSAPPAAAPPPDVAEGSMGSAPAAPSAPPAPTLADPTLALARTVEEGLVDLELCLRWARDAPTAAEKLKHVRMALRRLEDATRNLEALAKTG